MSNSLIGDRAESKNEDRVDSIVVDPGQSCEYRF
jgi:hypothetical protein